MKNIVLSSVVTALIVFTGCSTQEPVVDTTAQEIQEPVTQQVEVDTVSYDDSMSNAQSDAERMASIENQLPTVYFAFDKYNISADMQAKISAASKIAKTEADSFNVKLEGNCDEWGSDEYNFALGLKRADAVKKALVAQGVSDSRISMVSFGESNPVCKDKTKACWNQNRRVNFKLLP